MKIQLKRSNVLSSGAAKTPTASQLEYGELAVNYNNTDPAIFLKDSNNNVIRISGVGNISDDGLTNVPDGTNPPSNPEAGNLWYNSDQGRLYIYFEDADSSQWVDASPDSWDPSSYPDVTNSSAQSGTLDDRYAMVNGGNGLKIDSSGKVGIGTTSPSYLLDLSSSTNAYINQTRGNNVFRVGPATDQAADGTLIATYSNSPLRFMTNGSNERMRIDSSGRLLVGTTTEGNGSADDLTVETTGHTGVTIRSGNTNNGNIYFSDATSGAGEYSGYIQYRHDVNALALGTASSERMRIDSSGNVGIGTTSPAALLNLASDGPKLRFSAIHGGSNNYHDILASSDDFYINADVNNTGAGNLIFRNGGSNERLRIDSSGRLLVGTSSAFGGGSSGELLQVGFSGGSRVVFGNTSTSLSNGALIGQIDFNTKVGGSVSTGASIKANCDGTAGSGDAPSKLTFSTTADGASSPTERLRIDSSGQVGIGTSSPNHLLTLKGTQSFQATNSTNNWLAYTYTDNTFRLNYNGAGSDEVVIDSSGNVGIGSSSPAALLEIKGTDTGTGFPTLFLNRPSSQNSTSDIALEANAVIRSENSIKSVVNASGIFTWNIGGSDNKAGLAGSSEVMRMEAGSLMVGTTSPGATAGEQLTIAGSSNAGMTIRSSASSAGSILFEDTASDRGEIQYSHNGDYMRFKTAGSERMRIDSTGMSTFTASNAAGDVSAVKIIQNNANGYALWIGDGTATSNRKASILPNGTATFAGNVQAAGFRIDQLSTLP